MAETSWCLVGLAEPLQMQSHDRCKDILPLIPAGTKSGHSRWTDDECRLRKRPGSQAILILAVQGISPSGDEIVTLWLSLCEEFPVIAQNENGRQVRRPFSFKPRLVKELQISFGMQTFVAS
jgi:hypothetical protein